MAKKSFHLCLLLFLALVGIDPASAQSKRVALVIGNSSYRLAAPLKNPTNDAHDMSTVLRKLGFEVLEGRDLNSASMSAKIKEFVTALEGAEIALFFYAGHGIQVDGQNYLLPVDARMPTPASIDFELIPLDIVQRAMERSAKATVIFLDACRDNPLPRDMAAGTGTRTVSVTRGLARMEAGVGSLISFSTQPGNVALDGTGRNSPYVGSLVDHLTLADKDLSEILINVRRDVMRKTGNKQVPWEHSSLTSRVYFVQPSAPEGPSRAAPSERDTELALWTSVRDSGDPNLLQDYLERFPSGTFSRLAKTMLDQRQRTNPAMTAAATAELANPAQLASAMQMELRRTGCFTGPITGNWGPQSKAAVARLNSVASLTLSTTQPDPVTLSILRSLDATLCDRAPLPKQRSNTAARKKKDREPLARGAQQKREPQIRRAVAPAVARGGGGQWGYKGGLCIEGNLDHCRVACARGFSGACRLLRGSTTPDRTATGLRGMRGYRFAR